MLSQSLILRCIHTSKWKPVIPKHKIVIDKNTYHTPHPIWHIKDAENIAFTHVVPRTISDKVAYRLVRGIRTIFDLVSGYRPGRMNEDLYLRRCIFLETIAAVPGMIGGMMRHLASIRLLREDGGWIHHLLEEAENERMHLLTFLRVRQPGLMMRFLVIGGQFGFFCFYFLMYCISSKMSHRFVGYLEEEAVKTYTNLLKDMDDGKLPEWQNLKAPEESARYWGLPKDSSFRSLVVAIRADESFHREFNHHFADIPKNHKIEGHKYEILTDDIKWDTNGEEYPKEKEKEEKMSKEKTEEEEKRK